MKAIPSMCWKLSVSTGLWKVRPLKVCFEENALQQSCVIFLSYYHRPIRMLSVHERNEYNYTQS